MTKIPHRSGNQYLHRKPKSYRDNVRRKLDAYHRHIQTGLIAQGILQYLSSAVPKLVWKCFGSWLRTMHPDLCPSEAVMTMAMRNTLSEFLVGSSETQILTKFLRENIDLERSEGLRLIA